MHAYIPIQTLHCPPRLTFLLLDGVDLAEQLRLHGVQALVHGQHRRVCGNALATCTHLGQKISTCTCVYLYTIFTIADLI